MRPTRDFPIFPRGTSLHSRHLLVYLRLKRQHANYAEVLTRWASRCARRLRVTIEAYRACTFGIFEAVFLGVVSV